MGLIKTAYTQLFQSRGNITQVFRNFHSVQYALVQPAGSPKNVINNLQKYNFFNNDRNTLKIAVGPEFSMNQITNNEVIPISKKDYLQARNIFIEQAKALPEGGLFCPGTTAVDTGEKSAGGKKTGVNLGYFIATGSGEIMEWAKKSVSTNDNWPSDYEVSKGVEDVVVLVKRLGGQGRDVVLLMSTCLDVTFLSKLNPDVSPDFIISPAYGSPLPLGVEVVYPGAIFIVADNGNRDLDTVIKKGEEREGGFEDISELVYNSGMWDKTSKEKYWFSGISDFVGNFFSYCVSSIIPSLNGAKKITEVYSKIDTLASYYPEDNLAISEKRKLKDLTKEQLDARILYPNYNVFYNKLDPDTLLEKLIEATKTLQWDVIQDELNQFIRDYVSKKLSPEDPLQKSPDEWVIIINDSKLKSDLLATISLKTLELLVSMGNEIVDEVAEHYGDSINGLVRSSLGQKLLNRMLDTVSGPSYVDQLIKSNVFWEQSHQLSQQIEQIQQRLAENASNSEVTKQELRQRYKDLEQIREELATKKDDPELQEKEKRIDVEIEELIEKAKQIEKEQQEAEKEKQSSQNEMQNKNQEKNDIDKKEKENSKDIFKAI
ncbi:hypothetical protein NQ117_02835 [Paenibacillus sp. SC116]|uniref:hypothetical protein n=1 Tax=Paenibacillus sp. SC116 TaxID=2968986 RepID=UPI00215AEC50|nr:hypothetical protein [Paenibacillus sp. SC116]MCR8842606.1 hypothetical protein [Paenibacillus sp. SC116]